MSAKILDGKWVRDRILEELKPRIERLPRRPGLAAVLVGDDPASAIYVRNKIKAAETIGVYSEKIAPPDSISTDDLLGIVEGLNQRPEIDGILVQSPLPKHVDSRRILLAISPSKDVDGFHPFNVGCMVAGITAPRACTPAGIMEMLRRYEIPIAGKHAVVIGRSDIVGKPMAISLLQQNATVTICHSKTPDLAEVCRRAEILVAAAGRTHLVTAGFIGHGAVVIDVGSNRLPDGKPTGDVAPEAQALSAAYTPVPGGVGPLTIAMLMSNSVDLAERHLCSE